jgi:hypothetical protein
MIKCVDGHLSSNVARPSPDNAHDRTPTEQRQRAEVSIVSENDFSISACCWEGGASYQDVAINYRMVHCSRTAPGIW